MQEVDQPIGCDQPIGLIQMVMDRPKDGRQPISRQHPVLVLEGARGSGKTALVGAVERLVDQQVPHARLDSGRADQPDLFEGITTNICAVKPEVVFFAGRQPDLKIFLSSLEKRVCPDAPITLVTGGSDLGALKSDEAVLRNVKLTLAYSAATDPKGWTSDPAGLHCTSRSCVTSSPKPPQKTLERRAGCVHP